MSAPIHLSVHPLLADRVRIAIMAALASSADPLEFTYLVTALDVTKGNLSTHLRRLEEAKFILVKKEFVTRMPRTTYSCTAQGRRELERYLESVEQMLRSINTRRR